MKAFYKKIKIKQVKEFVGSIGKIDIKVHPSYSFVF